MFVCTYKLSEDFCLVSIMFAVLVHSMLFMMCEVVHLDAGGWYTCVTAE